jgi:hypothetical protein
MSSEARTPRTPAGLSGRDSLAGLIDVLDRADGGLVRQRPRPRRSAAYRPAGSRSGVRTVPLRSVQPAPMARPVPAAVPQAPGPAVTVTVPAPASGGLRALTRRIALWGSGPQGEYLAWHCAAPRANVPITTPPAAVHRPSRMRALVRRVALWGAGSSGEYLSWGVPRPVRSTPSRDVDGPVVLREMPSTPTIQPAAPSPAAALLPRGPASSAGPRGMPPVPRGAVAVPGVRPSGPPERSPATGWPSPARPSPSATGLVRARGDPLSNPARGSPPVPRRARSPNSTWSSFP